MGAGSTWQCSSWTCEDDQAGEMWALLPPFSKEGGTDVVGIVGTGVPQTCLPAAHGVAKQQAVRPIFTNKASETLVRGQAL